MPGKINNYQKSYQPTVNPERPCGECFYCQVGRNPVALFNDVEANAYGLETLRDEELVTQNVGSKLLEGNQAVVVTVGTSLGEIVLVTEFLFKTQIGVLYVVY